MSLTILIIDKTGKIKETTIRTFNEDDLYKKAGFKSGDGFKCYTMWNIEKLNGKSYNISVYGKLSGRANQENKYEFPPPIDNLLFFNSCVITNTINNIVVSLSLNEWTSIYNHLYGGFDDVGDDDEDEDEDDEDEDVDESLLTKSGYLKDDFIADDDEADSDESYEDEDEDEDEDEEDERPKPKSKPKIVAKTIRAKAIRVKSKVQPPPPPEIVVDTTTVDFIDCSNELTMESYLE